MPFTTLTLLEGRSFEEKRALLDATHDALMTAFGIPEDDRTQVINEIPPDNWDVAGFPDRIIVEIKVFAGRSLEAKRTLYRELVGNMEQCGVPPREVFIVVTDLPTENWGIRGGQAACDVDVGFKIDV